MLFLGKTSAIHLLLCTVNQSSKRTNDSRGRKAMRTTSAVLDVDAEKTGGGAITAMIRTKCESQLPCMTSAVCIVATCIAAIWYTETKHCFFRNFPEPATPVFSQKYRRYKWEAYCGTNWRRIAVQIGGVLRRFPFFKA